MLPLGECISCFFFLHLSDSSIHFLFPFPSFFRFLLVAASRWSNVNLQLTPLAREHPGFDSTPTRFVYCGVVVFFQKNLIFSRSKREDVREDVRE